MNFWLLGLAKRHLLSRSARERAPGEEVPLG